MGNWLGLLVIFQFKHFLADYPLQGRYMLRKFLPGWQFLFPLLAHVGVHGLFTYLIALAYRPGSALSLALFDMTVHFFMDRLKAGPKYLGRYKALSGNEMNQLLSMGKVHNGPPETAPIPSVTPEGEAWRQSQFRGNKLFWWSLGLDQMVHHLTHYAIIWRLLS